MTFRYSARYTPLEEQSEIVQELFGYDPDLKDSGPWELEQAVPIYLPSLHSFVLWWPWLQNFYGATGGGGYSNLDEHITYRWIDEAIKADMGYWFTVNLCMMKSVPKPRNGLCR